MTTNELLERALFCSYRDEWDKALEYAQSAIEKDPGNFLAYKRKSLALWNTDSKAEAIDAMKKCVELNPEFASGYYNLACFFAQENQKSEMLVHLEKAIKLDEFTDYREIAEEDEDFENFSDDEDFLKVIGSKKKTNKRLKEIFSGNDYDLINETILKIDHEIPLKAITWYSYNSDGCITGLMQHKGDKIKIEALVYLFNIVTMNTSIEEFDGFPILMKLLRSEKKEVFNDMIIQAWKNRYEFTDPGHIGYIEYQLQEAIQQLPIEQIAEITLWGLKSHGKDSLRDHEDLNSLLLEKLPDPHTYRTELVNIIDEYLHGDLYQKEEFEGKQRRIRMILTPPPVEYEEDSKDKCAYGKAAIAHFHPASVINGASRLALEKDPAIMDLVKQNLPRICAFVTDTTLPVDLRISAVESVIVKGEYKESLAKLGPALLDKSIKLLETIGKAMHKFNIVPAETKDAVSYLISCTEKEGIDDYELYDILNALRWFKDERVVPVLLSALGKGNGPVRRESLIGLGIQKAVSAIPEIVAQLTEGSAQCVTAAAKSLDAIGGDAWKELENKNTYQKVLNAAIKDPRWATEALVYFRIDGMIDDLIKLLKKNKEFEATPHLAKGIAHRASESHIPQLVQLGLDRYKGEEIGGRYFVEIFRSIARRNQTPSPNNVLEELKEILSNCDTRDLEDFIDDMKDDAAYADIGIPSDLERLSEEKFVKVYTEALKAAGDKAQELVRVMFLGNGN